MSKERAHCKGCEGLDDLYADGFCGLCRGDIEDDLRDEETGDLTKKGEAVYNINSNRMKQTTRDRLEYWGLLTAIALTCFSIYMTYVTTH